MPPVERELAMTNFVVIHYNEENGDENHQYFPTLELATMAMDNIHYFFIPGYLKWNETVTATEGYMRHYFEKEGNDVHAIQLLRDTTKQR
jgi:hypothetical protein